MSLPPSYNLLAKHPNKYYVETGIWVGDSIYLATRAGFQNIIGIELFKEQIDHVEVRFAGKDNITLIHGDSALCLETVMRRIDAPATIFLDSHSQLFEGEPKTKNPFPLLAELDQLTSHLIKTHTLIIDDILHLTHPDVTGWTKKDIEAAILRINPAYKIKYIANPVVNNLIVATV